MVTRQRIRSGLLLVSLLGFPLTLFYLSPYVALTAAMVGVVSGSVLLYLVELLGAVLVGRAWCGWIMPCGGLQEACFAANANPAKGGRLNWIKWFVWGAVLAALIVMLVRAGGIREVDPLRQTHGGISVMDPVGYMFYYGVVGVITVMALALGRRAFCHYACPMAVFMTLGRKLRNLLGLPALQLAAAGSQCAGCRQCAAVCPMSLDPGAMLRSARLENQECILCANCVDACPKKAIRLGFGRPEAQVEAPAAK
jgi:ferredoxin-type protein NapH